MTSLMICPWIGSPVSLPSVVVGISGGGLSVVLVGGG